MSVEATSQVSRFVTSPSGIDELIRALQALGYQTLGPTVRDGAIVIAQIDSVADLPRGWGDSQQAGKYSLEPRGDDALFGFAAPAGTWKRHLFPPLLTLFTTGGSTTAEDLDIRPTDKPQARRALIGIRGCDLAAITVQDHVFLGHAFADPHYAARRDGLFLVGVNCSDPASTCFCSSMGTGPSIHGGADLVLTELEPGDPDHHRFQVVAVTPSGRQVAAGLTHRAANAQDIAAAEQVAVQAADRMTRHLDTTGLAAALAANPDHPHWQEVADKCLSCANCTLVCPTCFCFDVTDEVSLDGHEARVRRWGSCFERSHSYLHGGSVRRSPRSRYRQWATHKFSSWWEQFGESGCVGCGRCIAWCPVGIDITEELSILRARSHTHPDTPEADQT